MNKFNNKGHFMKQLLKLEKAKTSTSNIQDFLRDLFSIENPLEFVKQTVNFTKNFTIDDKEKTATLEIKKELKYGILTMEMDEDGEILYSMKKTVKKAIIKLVYDLNPAPELPIVSLNPEKNFEPIKTMEPLAPSLPRIKQPRIPVLDLFVKQNVVPIYAINNDYKMFFETPVTPTYQEKFSPLNEEILERNGVETNPDLSQNLTDMTFIPLNYETPKLNPDLPSVNEYKRQDLRVERYDNTHDLNDFGVYQKIILNENSIIPGSSVYSSLINAGLDIETSYHKKWGTMLDGVNGIKNDNEHYWGLFVNGVAPSTAVDKIILNKDDDVELVYTEMSEGSCFAGRRITDFYSQNERFNKNNILGFPEIMYH